MAGLTTTKNSETDMTWPRISPETAGFVLTILFVLASISASYGVAQHQLNRHESKLAEVEDKVNGNENKLIEIASDVKWIRARMARDDRIGLGPRFGEVHGNSPPSN